MIGEAEIKEMEEALEEFQEKFEMEPDEELWKNLIKEEMTEVRKELADVMYVFTGLYVVRGKKEEDQSALINLFNAINDLAAPDTMEAFRRVHESNMSKLGEDGKPIRREDGKILKGPNYQPPYLGDLV